MRVLVAIVIVLVSVADSARAEESAAVAALGAAHSGDPSRFRLARTPTGQTRMIAGRFAVGTGPGASKEALTLAAKNFLSQHGEALGLPPAFDPARIGFDGLVETDAYRVLSGYQVVDGVRVLNGEFTTVFSKATGDLRGVNGLFVSDSGYTEGHDMDCAQAAEIASQSSLNTPNVDELVVLVREDGSEYCEIAAPPSLHPAIVERLADSDTKSIAWRVRFEDITVTIDEETEAIYMEASNFSHNASTISIEHSDYASNNVNNPSGNDTSSIASHYGEWFGTCTWELSYVEGSINNLDRVKDDDHSEASHAQACGTIPNFDASVGPWFDQQNAYYWTKLQRDWLNTQVWGVVGGGGLPRSSNVEINIHMGDPYCANGCYNEVTTDIYFHRNTTPDFDSYWHEYAHHFVWTYGGLGYNFCTFGINESLQLNETIADLIPFLLSTNYLGTQYNTTWTRIGGSVANEKHQTNLRSYRDQCSSDEHFFGDFFEQAFWEILHNVNCNLRGVVCDNTTTWGGNIGWASRSVARVQLARAIGNSIAVNQQASVTYEDFAFWLLDYIEDNHDALIASRARSVFNHHGMSL